MWCFWPKMYKNIRRFCSNCQECQICKGGLPPPKPSPLQNTEIPNEIFSTRMFDILKLSITPRQNQYLLVIICKYLHWTILIPMTDQSASTVTEQIFKHCICEFGVMKMLSSDRAAAFMGKVFKHLTEKFGIKHIVSSSQLPQSQGLVERANRVILSALSYLPKSDQKWDLYAPSISLALKSTPSKGLSGYTSFEIVTGRKCRVPEQHNVMGSVGNATTTGGSFDQDMIHLQESLSLISKIPFRSP